MGTCQAIYNNNKGALKNVNSKSWEKKKSRTKIALMKENLRDLNRQRKQAKK